MLELVPRGPEREFFFPIPHAEREEYVLLAPVRNTSETPSGRCPGQSFRPAKHRSMRLQGLDRGEPRLRPPVIG
jgi:hypothetical protein